MNNIKEMIESYDTIIIHRHKRPDFDAIGSQIGLKEILKLNYPQKEIYAVGEAGYEEFKQIGDIDLVSNSRYKNALVIVVDTANKIRIEDDRYQNAKELIKIDHHQDEVDERYGDYNLVVENRSSTSELVYYLAKNNNWKLNDKSSKALYYGIYGDTGGFNFSNTTSDTFDAASELVSYDWDFALVMRNLTTLPLSVVRLIGYAYENIKIENATGYIIFDKEFQKKHNYANNEISLVVNYLGTIKELDKWVVFNEYSNFVRVNIRSRKEYDISVIAKQYNGGGHKNASGASLKNLEKVDEVIDKLINLGINNAY